MVELGFESKDSSPKVCPLNTAKKCVCWGQWEIRERESDRFQILNLGYLWWVEWILEVVE